MMAKLRLRIWIQIHMTKYAARPDHEKQLFCGAV